VLLVKGYDSSRGWDLPGGFLRLGEVPEDGLARELYEELRAHVTGVKLISANIDLYGTQGEFSLNLFYEVILLTEELIPSNEIAQFSWFSLHELPVLEYQGTTQVLKEFAQRFCLP
jgi:ADP-ribose pyrophosphatase YjhB (NUDIX family)